MTPISAEVSQFPRPPLDPQGSEAVAGKLQELLPSYPIPWEFPEEILLGFMRDRRLRVVTPITITCSRENEKVILHAIDFDEFGFADNLTDALVDLQAAIAELFFSLKEDEQRLGPDLRRVWVRLQDKIRFIQSQ